MPTPKKTGRALAYERLNRLVRGFRRELEAGACLTPEAEQQFAAYKDAVVRLDGCADLVKVRDSVQATLAEVTATEATTVAAQDAAYRLPYDDTGDASYAARKRTVTEAEQARYAARLVRQAWQEVATIMGEAVATDPALRTVEARTETRDGRTLHLTQRHAFPQYITQRLASRRTPAGPRFVATVDGIPGRFESDEFGHVLRWTNRPERDRQDVGYEYAGTITHQGQRFVTEYVGHVSVPAERPSVSRGAATLDEFADAFTALLAREQLGNTQAFLTVPMRYSPLRGFVRASDHERGAQFGTLEGAQAACRTSLERNQERNLIVVLYGLDTVTGVATVVEKWRRGADTPVAQTPGAWTNRTEPTYERLPAGAPLALYAPPAKADDGPGPRGFETVQHAAPNEAPTEAGVIADAAATDHDTQAAMLGAIAEGVVKAKKPAGKKAAARTKAPAPARKKAGKKA